MLCFGACLQYPHWFGTMLLLVVRLAFKFMGETIHPYLCPLWVQPFQSLVLPSCIFLLSVPPFCQSNFWSLRGFPLSSRQVSSLSMNFIISQKSLLSLYPICTPLWSSWCCFACVHAILRPMLGWSKASSLQLKGNNKISLCYVVILGWPS